jgi:hypothetical protein
MASLARRVRAQKLAQAAAAAGGVTGGAFEAPAMPELGEAATEYRMLLAALHNDLREVKDIQSHEARIPEKRARSAKYRDWVLGALQAGKDGHAVQDEILVTMMIWAIDFGDYDMALTLAEHALAHGLNAPQGYSRSLACVFAEEIAEDALAQPEIVTLAQLQRTDAITGLRDMPDQVRAKLLKALGRAYAIAAQDFDVAAENAVAGGLPALWNGAIISFERANQIDPKGGVKNDLKIARAALAKIAGQAAPQDEDQEDNEDNTETPPFEV